MKLAEALTERSDIQKRISQLSIRLKNNARIQEGEKPAEDPKALMKELEQLIIRLTELITRINETNAKTMIAKESMTSLLAKRDTLIQKIDIYREFLNQASSTVIRNTKTEIKILPSVTVTTIQKQVDSLSKELRQLDIKIQELNWTTELV